MLGGDHSDENQVIIYDNLNTSVRNLLKITLTEDDINRASL